MPREILLDSIEDINDIEVKDYFNYQEYFLSVDQAKVISACASSCIYFIETLAWVEQKENRAILPFDPYPYQLEILRNLQNGESMVINKSRRVGVSWIVAAYIAWVVNFQPGANCLLLSKKESDAKTLLSKVRFILNNLAFHDADEIHNCTSASFVRGDFHIDNQTHLAIAWHDVNGKMSSLSEVRSLTTTGDSGRGEGASIVFWDEAAFCKPDDQSTWSAISPTTLRGGQVIVASTPNSADGVFYDLVRKAETGEEISYKFLKVHWSEAGITAKQIKKIKQMMDISDDKFQQEFELKFIQSGNPAINAMYIDACFRDCTLDYEIENYLGGYQGRWYLGADTAAGSTNTKRKNPDWHALVGITDDNVVKVLHRGREPLSEWAGGPTNEGFRVGLLSELHKKYPGHLIIERAGPGYTTYTNYVPTGNMACSMEPGLIEGVNKNRLIEELIIAIENNTLTIVDKSLYYELKEFQHGTATGRYGHPPSGHDDLVLALAWAYRAKIKRGTVHEMMEIPKNLRMISSGFFPEYTKMDDMPFGFGGDANKMPEEDNNPLYNPQFLPEALPPDLIEG